MILCLTVHEYAHALAARFLGDTTAEAQGRLTLNPVSHIDPFGTLLFPLVSIFMTTAGGVAGFPYFGWAKPVPYNPLGFRRPFAWLKGRPISMRLGTVVVAAAGPLSNLVFALLCTAGLMIWYRWSPMDFTGPIRMNPGVSLLYATMQINVMLFLFNLIPIPPLDGSRVLANLLPPRFEPFFVTLERYAFFIFMVLLATRAFSFIAIPATVFIRAMDGLVRG